VAAGALHAKLDLLCPLMAPMRRGSAQCSAKLAARPPVCETSSGGGPAPSSCRGDAACTDRVVSCGRGPSVDHA